VNLPKDGGPAPIPFTKRQEIMGHLKDITSVSKNLF